MAHRILILGNRGMLGHMVEHVLASDPAFAVRGVGRAEFDIFSSVIASRGEAISPLASLNALLANTDYIINCIGITTRHINENDPASVAQAIHVNAAFPHALAAAAAEHGVRVIHMSTDGVFSGNRTAPYAEDDPPDATDTYGRTKILGESRSPNVLNIRCSIIGPSPHKREGLWDWVATQSDGATIDGYTNHLWHGVTTAQFAELCRRIIADRTFDDLRSTGHILHFAPNAPLTKAELGAAIAESVGKRISVRPVVHATSIRRALAMRPDLADLSEVFGTDRPLAEALRACAAVTE
ncbi:sugar nucleotide-binding protein [Candidatus Uhrbacteria bacterium]|nr:sugar nucleotide-binding protein [Candidatus Uhrbacteria bacterium]